MTAALCAAAAPPARAQRDADVAVARLDAVAAHYCLPAVSAYAQVDQDLLLAIAYVESRGVNTAVSRPNRNGTTDVCAFQINTIHEDRLAELGVDRDRLLDEPCTCAAVAGHVLAEMQAYVGDAWDAVAAYNAGPRRLQHGRAYEARVRATYGRIKTTRAEGR